MVAASQVRLRLQLQLMSAHCCCFFIVSTGRLSQCLEDWRGGATTTAGEWGEMTVLRCLQSTPPRRLALVLQLLAQAPQQPLEAPPRGDLQKQPNEHTNSWLHLCMHKPPQMHKKVEQLQGAAVVTSAAPCSEPALPLPAFNRAWRGCCAGGKLGTSPPLPPPLCGAEECATPEAAAAAAALVVGGWGVVVLSVLMAVVFEVCTYFWMYVLIYYEYSLMSSSEMAEGVRMPRSVNSSVMYLGGV